MKASGCSSAHTDRQEMNMNVEKISNPQWADKDHTAVNCMVKFEHIEQAVPFTSTARDT
ncbi:DUF4376 domain-containing protein, partial [Escherichia coli]|nr:DUF4376 domain-containing protein [Escherichia coli]